MKFIKVKATKKNTDESFIFLLNTDLVKVITEENAVILKNDGYNVLDEELIVGLNTFKDIHTIDTDFFSKQ